MGGRLVHELSALSGVASAGDLDVLEGELVVVGQLLADLDLPEGEDDDVLLAQHVHDLGIAVGLEREMIIIKQLPQSNRGINQLQTYLAQL